MQQATEMRARHIPLDPDPFGEIYIAAGYEVGNLIFISGQAAVDGSGEIVGIGDFDAQVEQVMANVAHVLETAGSSIEQIFKVTIFVTDMKYYPSILELRRKYFKPPYPADTIVEVGALAMPDFMLELEAIALKTGDVS